MRAFSLLELMVVIAIVAVLAVMASPSYLSYMNQAKVSNTTSYVENIRSNIENYYTNHGHFPSNATEATYDRYVTGDSDVVAIWYYGCDQPNAHAFFIEFSPDLNDHISGSGLVYVVTTQNGVFQWYCRQGGDPLLDMEYVPHDCTAASGLTAICDTSSVPTIVE